MNLNTGNSAGLTGTEAEPVRAHLFRAWRQLLADCAAIPTRKRVHGLRVVTMRLQATIDACLASEAQNQNQAAQSLALAAAKRWKKRAKRLRRRLSAVRSLDVYLIKLTGLRAHLEVPDPGLVRGSARAAAHQLAPLENRLKRNRRAAAKKLALALRHRLGRLTRLGVELEALLPSEPAHSSEDVYHRMLADLKSVLESQPKLDAGTLHEFRKQIKGFRYRAESAPESDPRIAHFAKTVKAIQDAIGEWHDWKAVAKEAVEKKPAGRGALAALLQTRAAESLKEALQVCESSIAELGLQPFLPVARRKPVCPEEPVTIRENVEPPSGFTAPGNAGLRILKNVRERNHDAHTSSDAHRV